MSKSNLQAGSAEHWWMLTAAWLLVPVENISQEAQPDDTKIIAYIHKSSQPWGKFCVTNMGEDTKLEHWYVHQAQWIMEVYRWVQSPCLQILPSLQIALTRDIMPSQPPLNILRHHKQPDQASGICCNNPVLMIYLTRSMNRLDWLLTILRLGLSP